jgi:MOSC domain-containing protein YiiM
VLTQISRSKGGIPKFAAEGPVMLTASGIEGDSQRDLRHHGGPDKAVLMIAAELLDELVAQGFPVYPGALGENLTVSGIDPRDLRAGKRFRIGDDAVIQLTTLREPCANLLVYGRSIIKHLAQPGCVAGGFYARVITPGLLTPGLPVVAYSLE